MQFLRWGFGLVLVFMFMTLACRDRIEEPIASSGSWSLEYTGICEARESESLDMIFTDEGYILFDDYTLIPDETGVYVGNAQFSAPMPADGRDIVFIVEFTLQQESRTVFTGTESVTEIGRGRDGCPVQLVYIGEP